MAARNRSAAPIGVILDPPLSPLPARSVTQDVMQYRLVTDLLGPGETMGTCAETSGVGHRFPGICHFHEAAVIGHMGSCGRAPNVGAVGQLGIFGRMKNWAHPGG